MKFFSSFFLSSLFVLSSVAFADTIPSRQDVEDNEIRALKEWLDTKRQVSLKEIGGDLSMSGEVRTEFQDTWEKKHTFSSDRRTYDIEFNFMLDYRTDRTWSSIKIEFDNDAGIFFGTLNKIALERAYWGARAIERETFTLDIEIGRRFMGNVFDSRLEFASFFDGILFRFDKAFEKVGDFYVHVGPFVVNERNDHYAYVGEIGFLNIMGTGLYTKVSVVDWDTKHYHPKERFEEEDKKIDQDKLFRAINQRFHFIVMQILEGYRFKIKCLEKIGILYGAFLWNFGAERLEITDHKRANWGAYIGFSLGQLRKQWDWALDVNYQVVAAQAVPDFDVSGIGLGDGGTGFYTNMVRHLLPDGNDLKPNSRDDARGQTNYRGFVIRLDVLLTDKLDLQQSYQQSIRLDPDIGPFRSLKQYELELIYSW